MQLTPTVASRPAASAQAHATDAEPAAESESFASLLAAPAEPAEPAVRSKGTAAPRERQSAKSDAGRSPRSATDGWPRHSPAAALAQHRTDGPAGAATDTSATAEHAAKRGDAVGAGDTDLNDWLATLIHWPGTSDMSAAPSLPSAADAAILPAGKAANDAKPTLSLDSGAASVSNSPSPGSPPGSMPLGITAPAGSVPDRPSPGVAMIPTLESTTTGLEHRHIAAQDRADADSTHSHPGANPALRGAPAQREASRSGDAASARDQPADVASTQAGTAAQADVATMAMAQQGAPRSLSAPGTAADPVPVPMSSTSGVTDRPPAADTAPVSIPVPLPLDDPRFAQALGTQVSLLARDGVHEASLQLNPAEMGPISVQIVLEGTQARVEFGADMARTREVIERSLPELAAALRDAGLTLSGGSVSQHQPGRGDGQSDPDGQRGRGGMERADRTQAVAGDPQTTPTRRWVRTGGLDLYA